MKKEEFTVGEIDEAAGRLRAVPPVDATKRRISTREAVGRLKGAVEHLKDGGYALEEIAGFLVGEGIEISVSALREHLRNPKKRRAGGSRRKITGASGGSPPATPPAPKPAVGGQTPTRSQSANGAHGGVA